MIELRGHSLILLETKEITKRIVFKIYLKKDSGTKLRKLQKKGQAIKKLRASAQIGCISLIKDAKTTNIS